MCNMDLVTFTEEILMENIIFCAVESTLISGCLSEKCAETQFRRTLTNVEDAEAATRGVL